MTAAYRVVTAERKDIEVVTVICNCGAEVSINAIKAQVPFACPSCNEDYGQNIREALTAFGRFQRTASAAEEHAGKPIFRFNIRQAD
jgi:hypothetical protein